MLRVVFSFRRSKDWPSRGRVQALAPGSMSRAWLSLAGFQVTGIGRIWVTAVDELVRCGGKWDKENRRNWGLCPGVDRPRSVAEAEPPPEEKTPTGRELRFSAVPFRTVI